MKTSRLWQRPVTGARLFTWAVARSDIREAIRALQEALAMLTCILMLPFRAIATMGRMAAAIGRGLLRWAIQLCFGLIGLSFVGFVGFGIVRVVFHPLFVR